MAFAVPTEQYRSNYTFLTPATYTLNYVNVTAPTGMDGGLASTITLDGEAIDPAKFKAVGDSGKFLAARVPLPCR